MNRTEKMNDEELSERLGKYQKRAEFWLWVGLIGVAGGLVAYFAVNDRILKVVSVSILFFGGLCCILFLRDRAQKKLKALMTEQLGDFFRTEIAKAFGPELQTEEMRIDRQSMEGFRMADGQWEECEVENYHEGLYHGIHFSAANVCLNHVYERRHPREGRETYRNKVFHGLVIRCEITSGTEFGTSQSRKLEQAVEGQFRGFYWKGDILSLAIETDYGFAAVAENVNPQDLDAVRKSYVLSLREMQRALDLIRNDT